MIRSRILGAATSAALCALFSAAPAQAEPKMFGNAVSMGTVPGTELTPTQKRAFSWYRKNKSYFGAFYVAPGTEHLFWTRSFHSMKTAKEAAKKGCEIVSEGAPCTLHALLYPTGVDPNGPDITGLGQDIARDFQRKYPKRQKGGKYGAFAINGGYGYGFSFGWDTAEEANAAALSYCKADSANSTAPLGIEGRKWVEKKGLAKCRVIDTLVPAQS